MNNRHVFGLLVAGTFALSASAIAIAATAPTAPAAPAAPRAGAPAAPAGAAAAPGAPPAGGGLQILDFKPAFDDMMTMLIQPRHIKLWAAAQAQNWPLAAFELNEMRGAFDRIAQTLPKYRNVNLGPTFISMMSGPIMQTNAAIGAKSPQQFANAYKSLTNTCNSCHEALDHPFLVIKMPDANALSAYVDQEFKAPPAAK